MPAYPEYVDSGVDWLGRMPSHWVATGVKRFAESGSGVGFPIELQGVKDEKYPFYKVNALARADADGVIRFREDTVSEEIARSLRAGIFPAGAIVLAKIGAALLLGRIRTLGSAACLDNNMMAVIPGKQVERDFLRYQLENVDFALLVNPGAVPSLSDSRLMALTLAWPPLAEQAQIESFLNRETASIDAFIAEQGELIELLIERRDAGWQAALDDLNVVDVPLRRVITSIVDGPFGSSLTSAHYTDDGARVIRLGNIGINEFKDVDQAFVSMRYFAELAVHSVRRGDVVVAGLGDDRMPLGRAAVVPDIGPAIVKADCYRLRPGTLVTSEYLAWVLSAPQTRARMRDLSRGSTRQRLNTSVVRDVAIPLPPLEVQSRVVQSTNEYVRELDAAIADAREAIALSRERRAALISAAVTGKIDVRGAA